MSGWFALYNMYIYYTRFVCICRTTNCDVHTHTRTHALYLQYSVPEPRDEKCA